MSGWQEIEARRRRIKRQGCAKGAPKVQMTFHRQGGGLARFALMSPQYLRKSALVARNLHVPSPRQAARGRVKNGQQ
ncbi:hypothetical protein EFR84_26070 [Rhizobium chutanense]|uniref:Uncharacterized protein n=1 Tax=Rhizobium chutanense TaxID=2035448 RepID=A0A3S0XI12_9HYPH|nr:hypothetical protein EFR84_26070 [Rhizobium chutanense]